MATDSEKPLLNPVLMLRREARREAVTGGGKGVKDILVEQLAQQRVRLAQSVDEIVQSRPRSRTFGGKMHLLASMFEGSLAPSWAPTALFAETAGCRLVAPARGGYLVEATVSRLGDLANVIRQAGSVAARVDISRVEKLARFGNDHVLRQRSLDGLWLAAPETEDGRLFLLWLVPFRDAGAREALMHHVEVLVAEQALLPTNPSVQLPAAGESDGYGGRALRVRAPDQTSLGLAFRRYRNTGHGYASVRLRTKSDLLRLMTSGIAYRVDPVRPFTVRSAGQGREPPPPSKVAGQPIVAIVDGGLTAASYRPAEAWRAPAFLPDGVANHVHGNRVASLAVHAHAWNGNLSLPELHCRIGTVQAVPKDDANYPVNPEEFINYLRAVAAMHRETKVWNFSFNEPYPVDMELTSFLGHGIATVAREFDFLPVISGGNRIENENDRICPPSDCEAALVVGGRLYDGTGKPGERCPSCLAGPGPEGMQKPDLSWFSRVRMLGGQERVGSSYSTPLVSSLAAHAFANLKDPAPDLVRALLLNTAELESFDNALGWGTPYNGHLPWLCRPGSVTLAWRSKLRPKTAYYWDGIPIPPQLVRDGRLHGTASLTAVLKPVTTDEGAENYFVTRLQTSLQYQRGKDWINLLGSMKEDKAREQAARRELAKWQPIRCHRRDFIKGRGLSFCSNSMRLYARVFARDLFQLGNSNLIEASEHDVSFVLSFGAPSEDDAGIYDEVRSRLGQFVESAVLEQEVEVEL